MPELQEYDAVINGWPTTVKLTADEAHERGLSRTKPATAARARGKGRQPANKSRTAANKNDGADDPGTDGDPETSDPDVGTGIRGRASR